MIALIFGMVLIIFGLILDCYEMEYLGSLFETVGVGVMVFIVSVLIYLPIDARNVVAEHKVLATLKTDSMDVRNASYGDHIININKKIEACKKNKNNFFYGVFYNKKICNLEPLKIPEDN